MSIEQKIQQILAESQSPDIIVNVTHAFDNDWSQDDLDDYAKEISKKHRVKVDMPQIDPDDSTVRPALNPDTQIPISGKKNHVKNAVIDHYGDEDLAKRYHPNLFEETEIDDPLAQIEIEPNNARNNVDRQYLPNVQKDENEHTENAAPAEQSNLEPLAFKEDIDALVSGEKLTEEFKQKAATIFEAAVLTRVKQEVARLDEAYQVQLDERVEEIKEGLVEKVDGYLDYVVEQWMKDNEIALESGMKSEILEGFVSGLKGLFEQHYIEVPEEKFDVLGSMQEQIAGLTTKLDEQVETNIELRNKLAYAQAEAVVRDLAEGLTDTDKDKFFTLVEELEFNGVNSFTKKAQTIRESYFTKKAPIQEARSYVVTDTPVVLAEETKRKQQVDPQMANYLNVLNNLIK